ncbi:unnamed protein product, partial [Candidula unifasciata]
LQQLLQEQHSAMTRLQSHAHLQQVKANLLTTSLRAKLRRKERKLNLLKSEHEQQISAVLSHLLYLEGHMQKEQNQVLEILHDKDEIIIRQAGEIKELRAQNNRFREQLKERPGYPPDNGLVKTISHLAHPDEPTLVPDTENRMFLRGSKNKQGEQIYGNGHRVRFSEMKDRLRRHKSSLELYQHEPLETLVESNLKYGSQENLIAAEGNQSKIHSRKDKCQSLIDYPMFLHDRAGRLTDDGDGQLEDFHSPIISRHDSTSSLVIFDEKTAKQHGTLSTSLAYGFNELSKSKSVPHALSMVSEKESVVDSFKMRPKFLPNTAMSTKNSLSATATTTTITPATISASSSMINLSPHRSQTTVSSPTESNPFKSFKNVFKRKGSKKKKSAPSSSSKDQKDAVK